MCDSGLHPGAGEVFSVKDTIGTIGKILVWLVYYNNVKFFEFDNETVVV